MQPLRNSVTRYWSEGCAFAAAGGGWGGTVGSEAGKWAGTQPEGPVMYNKVFGFFLN